MTATFDDIEPPLQRLSQSCPTCPTGILFALVFCYPMERSHIGSMQVEMEENFSDQLDRYIRQARLSLRQIAGSAGIPHQTIHNWVKGSQPRWHGALPNDLQRLRNTLGLTDQEITFLLQLAGCSSTRSTLFVLQEAPMQSTFRIPKGWSVTSDTDEMIGDYEIGVDPDIIYEGRPCVTIKAKPDPSEFAGLAQQVKADYYHGKRLQFSAAVRSQDLKN